MTTVRTLICFCFGGSALAAVLAFEVASIRPAAPLDMAKIMAAVQAGQSPKIGPQVGAERAEYTYMALRDLIALAYGVKPYQISGPDWLANQRFDIVAKLPAGASKDDAPAMLQALLADRFGLVIHRSSAEHPVLALLVGKGGPKLREAIGTPTPIDENTPLKPGEVKVDSVNGPLRMTMAKDGSATVNMGSRGMVAYRTDPATQAIHIDGDMLTISGFADMLTQFSQLMGGTALQFVDMTGLQGHYQVKLDISQAERANMARSMGIDVAPGGVAASPPGTASDPGGASLLTAIQDLGLKLEQRKAVVEQLIVDHMEKTPTEN